MNVNMDNENAEKLCVICRSSLCDTPMVLVSDCGHRFHPKCIQRSSETNDLKCPICSNQNMSILSSPKRETEEDNTLPETKALPEYLSTISTTVNNYFEQLGNERSVLTSPSDLNRCPASDTTGFADSNNKYQEAMNSQHHPDILTNSYTLPIVRSLSTSAPPPPYEVACPLAATNDFSNHTSSTSEKNMTSDHLLQQRQEQQDDSLPEWECQSCTFRYKADADCCSECTDSKRPYALTQKLRNNNCQPSACSIIRTVKQNQYPPLSNENSTTTDTELPPYQEKMSIVTSTSNQEAFVFIPDLPFNDSDTDLEQMIQKRLTNSYSVHVTKVQCYSNIGVGIVYLVNETDKTNLLKNIQSTVLDPQTNTIISFVEQLDLVSYLVFDQTKKTVATSDDIARRWQQLTKSSQLCTCEMISIQFPNIFKIVSHSLEELLAVNYMNTFKFQDQPVSVYLRADCSFFEDLPRNVTASQITIAINAQIGGQFDQSLLYVQYNKDASNAIVLAMNAARKWTNIHQINLNDQICKKKKRLDYRLVIHQLPRHMSNDLVIKHHLFRNNVIKDKRIGDKLIIEIDDKSVYDACLSAGVVRIGDHSVLIEPFSAIITDPENMEINADTWYETDMLNYQADIKPFVDDPRHPIFQYKWNAQSWIEQFKRHEGVHEADSDRKRRLLRVTVMLNTIGVLQKNSYTIQNVNNEKKIKLNTNRPQNIIYNHRSRLAKKKEITTPLTTPFPSTKVEVVNEDCLVVYEKLASERTRPLLLNMANAVTPGGGYRHGAGAQEENLFRRSNYYFNLDMELDEKKQADRFLCTADCVQESIGTHHKIYPIDEFGAIYTSDITVFRHSEDKGYAYLEQPVYGVCSIAVAAYCRPELKRNNKKMLSEKTAVNTRKKIENLFAIAHHHGHECLVLSAFGCGAFRNPPTHIAMIFKSVIEQYAGYFKNISFSIIDDHNTGNQHNPVGNYLPFKDILDKIIVYPPKRELDVNMISGPYRITEKSHGKMTIDHVRIFDITPCRFGGLCNDLSNKQHCHSYSHPPLCLNYQSCDPATNDDVHNSSFIHRIKCQYGGTCKLTKDENHLRLYIHPEICSRHGSCTDMDQAHLMKYHHVPLCKDGLKCLLYLKDVTEHRQSYRHCQTECSFGNYCVNFHDQEHIDDQTHPFRKPCPLTPFACKYHVEYLKEKKSPSSRIKNEAEEHCIRFSHVCPFGRECHDKTDLHKLNSIHVARNLCPEMNQCSKITQEEHLNSFTHPKIHDIRFMCDHPASECRDRISRNHIINYRHAANYNHIGVVHYSLLHKKTNFIRNQNELIKSIQTYTESEKWKPPKDTTTAEIIDWIRALQPGHRCDQIIFESILVHGHVMSRDYMHRLRDAKFVANAVDQHPDVRKIFSRYNNSALHSHGRDFIRALVTIEADKTASTGGYGAARYPPHRNDEQNQIVRHNESLMKISLQEDEINTIRKHAVRIAEASLKLHTNPMGIGHTPDESFDTNKHVFGILGPHLGYYYGDIFIIFKHEIMFHPDSNFSIQAATTFGESKNAYKSRPWLKDPGTPRDRIQHFHWTKLHCSVPGYEYAAAMELMALTGMKKKSMDVKLKDVQERWMNCDSHEVFESHLPQLIPLDYIDHVYIPKSVFQSLSPSAQRRAKRIFQQNLTITDHMVDLNALKQLDSTRISYQTYVLNEIQKKIANNNFHFHRGTIVTLPVSNLEKYISIPMTISQSFHQYDAKNDKTDTIFIYWQALGGDMMLAITKYRIALDKDQSTNPCLMCYIADTSSSNASNDYRESYSYITNNHPNSHEILVQSCNFKAKSNTFHRGCNINDYITYCLKIERKTGEVILSHVGANSLYNHQTISYTFRPSEFDLSKLDYVQVSAYHRIVPVRNLVIRHERIEEFHPSFDKNFKEGSEPSASPSKGTTNNAAASSNDDHQKVEQSVYGYLKDKLFGKNDTPLIPCRDSVNCQIQYSCVDSKRHNQKYSHPCRFSELCLAISDHPHLEHNMHSVTTCRHDKNCRERVDPFHRAQYHHSGLPDFLFPCRSQRDCRDKSIKHRVKYSHGERVSLSTPSGASPKLSPSIGQNQAYGYGNRGHQSPKDNYNGGHQSPKDNYSGDHGQQPPKDNYYGGHQPPKDNYDGGHQLPKDNYSGGHGQQPPKDNYRAGHQPPKDDYDGGHQLPKDNYSGGYEHQSTFRKNSKE